MYVGFKDLEKAYDGDNSDSMAGDEEWILLQVFFFRILLQVFVFVGEKSQQSNIVWSKRIPLIVPSILSSPHS